MKETNCQLLRALIACLGISKHAAAVEIGVSRTMLENILTGKTLPPHDAKGRILAMSQRWSKGDILSENWPPPAVDHRAESSPLNAKKPRGKRNPVTE